MPVAGIGAAIGGIGSIVGGIMGGQAAKKAAAAQAAKAEEAARVSQANAANARDYQNQTLAYQRGIQQPWLGAGASAITEVARRLGLSTPTGISGPNVSAVTNPAVAGQPGAGVTPSYTPSVNPLDPSGHPYTIGSVLSTGPSAVQATGMRFGGKVKGSGGPTSDTVPIKASPGEFVVRANVAEKPQVLSMLEALNRGGKIGGTRYAEGGLVAAGTPSGLPVQGPMPPTISTQEMPAQPTGGDMPLGAPGTPQPSPSAAPSPIPANTPNALPTGSDSGFGSLTQGWNTPFQAPTDVTEQTDPGFQFRLAQGQKAIERSAAARGGLLTGGTLKDLTDYGQNAASAEYGNVYGRRLGEYQQAYNIFNNNQNNLYNRLMGISNAGQGSANVLTGAAGQGAGNISGVDLTSAGQIGQDLTNAGTARASGYVGAANAYGSILPNVGNTLSLYSLLNPGGGSNSNPYGPMYPGSDSWMLQPR